MTNLIVLSYVLVTNPVQQAIIGQTNGQAIVVNQEYVEAVTEVGFKSKKGFVPVGESRKVQSVKTWTNLARVAIPPSVPAPAMPSTNAMPRGQLMRLQRERERTNTVSKPATNAPTRAQLLRQQREFARTNTAKAKP